MKRMLLLALILVGCTSFHDKIASQAIAQNYTYGIQISGTYESVEGRAKKWTNWLDLDHAIITFGTESIPHVDAPDEFPIDGDLVQDWYIDFDTTGAGLRLITFTFDMAAMPYLSRKGMVVYALRYRVSANHAYSNVEAAVIDSEPGKPIKG